MSAVLGSGIWLNQILLVAKIVLVTQEELMMGHDVLTIQVVIADVRLELLVLNVIDVTMATMEQIQRMAVKTVGLIAT